MKILSSWIVGASLAFSLAGTARSQIVINEIMYHPASEDPREEYIELLNTAATNVNLSGWTITSGIDFTFAPGTTLGAGQYLVVAAHAQTLDAKYSNIPNLVGNWLTFTVTNVNGRSFTNWAPVLSNTRNTIKLNNASGNEIDSVTYADEGDWAVRQRGPFSAAHPGWEWYAAHDGLGRSLELISPAMPNEHGQNWGASAVLDGTPGFGNSISSGNVAPFILDAHHTPVVPRSTDPVSITARILNETSSGLTVTVKYRPDSLTPPLFTSAPMFDDGAHGDGAAGDGIYGVILPPFGANNVLIEFYIEASDAQANTRTWPAAAIDQVGAPLGQAANALFQVDDATYPTTAPLYKLIMTAADIQDLTEIFNSDVNSDAQMNATFISIDGSGIENHYLTGIRNRGHGSRSGTPHNYRVGFRSDDRWKGIDALNLNARAVHVQHFGSVIAQKAGVAGGDSRAVQLKVNNGSGPGGTPAYGLYAANQDVGSDWAEHQYPSDSGGNVYRVVRDIAPPTFNYRAEDPTSYFNTYFKQSNTSENEWQDLIGMLQVMGDNSGALLTTDNARKVINVEQWLTHVAVMSIFNNRETGLNTGYNDDYFMYRGVKDPRFVLVYHDLDTIMGQGDSSGSPTDGIFTATANNGSGAAFNRFMHWPDFEPIYYRILQRLLDTTFSAAQYNALIDETLGSYVPVSTINAMKTWMNTRRSTIQSMIAPFVTPAPVLPVATVSGEPRSPTASRSATLVVGGVGVTHYRYALNGGAYGAETPVATPISLSSLPNLSTNYVSVIGRDGNGVWQGTDVATRSQSWVVNTAWPTVRLNEILARNDSAVSHSGSFPDLIELFNEGTGNIDLSGMRLTDDTSDPGKFAFPAGTTLAAGAYVVVYADSSDGTPGLHLGFSLGANGDAVYLYNRVASGGALLDSVAFGFQVANLSIGRLGTSGRWSLCQPTFGTTNSTQATGASTELRINEWLAADEPPVSEDFIELYNPGSLPVDLSGLYLTDEPIGAPARHPIAPLSFIPANGYVAFIADGQGNTGPDHLKFKLASEQGEIALSAADLSVIDYASYGPQTTGISMGRCPDGAIKVSVQAGVTPGAPNSCPPIPVPPVTVTLVSYDAMWRYDQVNNYDGVNWFAPGYDDSSWLQGPGVLARLSNGSINQPIGTILNVGRMTYYFRIHFSVPVNAGFTSLQIAHFFDDGAVVYLNGQEGYRYNLPAGPISYGLPATQNISGSPSELGPFPFPMTNMVIGDNVLTVEVHQNSLSSADVFMGLKLDGVIVSNTTATAGIVMNEVLANNATTTELDGRTPDWIELYNPSNLAVDLAGMSLNDQLDNTTPRWVFPAGSIVPAKGYLVIYADGDAPVSAINTGFGLKANGGSVFLFKKAPENNQLVDRVDYGLQVADLSIGRVPAGSTNWVLNLPTAGSANIAVTLGDPLSLRINEWMADPSSGDDWFEVYNGDSRPVSLSGLGLTDIFGDLQPYRIPVLSYIGTGSNAFQRFEADEPSTPAGPEHVDFKLSKSADNIFLLTPNGAQIDAVSWAIAQATDVSEGRLPDGAATIVRFPESTSPGAPNFLPLTNVVVSEVLSHTDLPLEDAVEFQNIGSTPVNISGWFLSDDKDALRKFRIPDNTPSIPAGGFKVFFEYQFNNEANGAPFSFSSANGDQVYLSVATANGQLTGYRAVAKFGASANGVSFGRYRTSVGFDFTAMSQRTFGKDNPINVADFRTGAGKTNAYPKIGAIIISEIMYHPPDIIGGGATNDNVIEEFVELRNTSASTVPLYDPIHSTNGWRLRDAVDFRFNASHSIAAGGHLIVVSFDPATNAAALAQFQSRYGSGATLVGPYSGKLDNGGESVELVRPDSPQPDGSAPSILVEKVVYQDHAPWPVTADGLGLSLQRVSATGYANDPTNWVAAAPALGSPGAMDTDGDGMSDAFEDLYGFQKTNPNDADLDFDLDGMTNLEEYLAGTHPKQAGSLLELAPTLNGNTTELRFSAVAGRTYTILYNDALTEGAPWQKLADVPAQGTTQVVMVPDNSVTVGFQRFYRIVTPALP